MKMSRYVSNNCLHCCNNVTCDNWSVNSRAGSHSDIKCTIDVYTAALSISVGFNPKCSGGTCRDKPS